MGKAGDPYSREGIHRAARAPAHVAAMLASLSGVMSTQPPFIFCMSNSLLEKWKMCGLFFLY